MVDKTMTQSSGSGGSPGTGLVAKIKNFATDPLGMAMIGGALAATVVIYWVVF